MDRDRIVLEEKFKRKSRHLRRISRGQCRALNYKVSKIDKWRNKIALNSFINSLSDKEIIDFLAANEKDKKDKKKGNRKIKKQFKAKSKKRKPAKRKSQKDIWIEKYKKYLKSDSWAKLKIDLFEIKGRNCERCGHDNNLQVHHITYDNLFNEEFEDLEILCAGCHMKEHGI